MIEQIQETRPGTVRDTRTSPAQAARGSMLEPAASTLGASSFSHAGSAGFGVLQARANRAAHVVNAARVRERMQGSPAVQRIARTRELMNRRVITAPPRTNGNGADPIQRKIRYDTASKRLGPVSNRVELIAAVTELFPLLRNVAALVDDIEQQDERWTLAEVYTALSREAAQIPMPIAVGELDDTIMMPSKPSHAKDFGFTTRTRARGRVDRQEGEAVPLRDASQRNLQFHAEDDVMQQLDKLLDEGKIDPADTIFITINNSPCGSRCAPNLAKWFQKRWTGRMVIQYANPYGNEAEFIKAREVLQAAGIEVSSFPAERYVEDNGISEEQRGRFHMMKRRRKQFRTRWNKKHPDDASSDSDAAGDSDDLSHNTGKRPGARSRSRSRSRDRDRSRSGSPSRKRVTLPPEIRQVEADGQTFVLDPDEIPNRGDCFYETLIALGVAGGRDVAGLRQLAVQSGARAEAGNLGEWANQGDIAAVAQGLGVRIVQVSLDLGYGLQQVTPVGVGDAVYVAHIFGGHYVPLRPS